MTSDASTAAKDERIADVGHRRRLDDVARRYYNPLLSFFRKRTRNAPEVQDLVQQVFLRLSQHPEIGAIQNPDADFSPERVLEGRQAIVRFAAALRELPERTRDIFVLRCFEGLKNDEIAHLQGVSTRSVEKHMTKALAHLSRAME